MDRSIAIEKAKLVLEEVTETEDAVCYVTSEDAEWLEMAIRALDQNEKLPNRCHVLSKGLLCIFCPYDCEYREGANSGT